MIYRHHRQISSLPTSVAQVPLHNRFEALELEGEVSEEEMEGASVTLPGARQLTPCLKTASAKKDRG